MINISSSNLAKIIEAYKVYFKEYFSIELHYCPLKIANSSLK